MTIMANDQTLGAVIREARESAPLTQAMLANHAGISPQYLNDIERDRRTPSEPVANALALALGLEMEWLSYLCGRFPGWLMHPDATRASIVAGFAAFRGEEQSR